MPRTRRELLGAAAASALLAGCLGGNDGGDGGDGGDGDGGDGSDGDGGTDGGDGTDGTDGDGTETSAGDATVSVRSHDDLGEILVGPDGLTLYMFDSDEQGAGESTCSGGCLNNWPPLTVDGESTAGDDVTAELTTFEREDGDTQVAANGWPLYYYVGDSDPGDVTGQGVSDVWWVLRPDGTVVRGDGGTTTSGGSGGGYDGGGGGYGG